MRQFGLYPVWARRRLRRAGPSTRGPGWTTRWWSGCGATRRPRSYGRAGEPLNASKWEAHCKTSLLTIGGWVRSRGDDPEEEGPGGRPVTGGAEAASRPRACLVRDDLVGVRRRGMPWLARTARGNEQIDRDSQHMTVGHDPAGGTQVCPERAGPTPSHPEPGRATAQRRGYWGDDSLGDEVDAPAPAKNQTAGPQQVRRSAF